MNFIKKCLEKKQCDRLGFTNGVYDLKQHPWFKDFDWAALKTKKMIPPFKPQMEEEPPVDPREPDEAEVNARKQLSRLSFQLQFKGYYFDELSCVRTTALKKFTYNSTEFEKDMY